MTETKTVRSLASDLADAFVHDKRNDGAEFVKLRDGSPQWMTDVIHAVHGEKMPDDTVYDFIERCTNAINDADEDAELSDVIMEIEADIYTSDLTGWLHSRVDHIGYVNEALEEMGSDTRNPDFASILQYAQTKQIQEIGYALISELEKLAE